MSALDRFRRAMRRHERRARRLGLKQAARDIRQVREAVLAPNVVATWEDALRFLGERKDTRSPAGMFLRRRATDALVALRGVEDGR